MELLTCAQCGAVMTRAKRSRPQGQAVCQPCRRVAKGRGPDEREPKPRPRVYPKRLTCATCAKPIYKGGTSLPQGLAQCRDCRRPAPPRCSDCGVEVASRGTVRCRLCRVAYLDRHSASGERRRTGTGRRIVINGTEFKDPRETGDWRTLRDQVVYEEPLCTLNLGGCTGWSETADHITPVIERPDLGMVRANLRGSCESCNMRRPRQRGLIAA